MGLFDQVGGGKSRSDEIRLLRAEVADLGHNLKRVMEQLGIDYERNPLLEVSGAVLRALQQGQDALAVDTLAREQGVEPKVAAEYLGPVKVKLDLGDLIWP